jgi:hypothetical protein
MLRLVLSTERNAYGLLSLMASLGNVSSCDGLRHCAWAKLKHTGLGPMGKTLRMVEMEIAVKVFHDLLVGGLNQVPTRSLS